MPLPTPRTPHPAIANKACPLLSPGVGMWHAPALPPTMLTEHLLKQSYLCHLTEIYVEPVYVKLSANFHHASYIYFKLITQITSFYAFLREVGSQFIALYVK